LPNFCRVAEQWESGARLGREKGPVLKIARSATEAEMVLAFLRAELDSPTYPTSGGGASVREWLAHRGYDASLVESGDPSNADENAKREIVLGDWRGYRRNAFLFTGFPDDVMWHWATLTAQELADARYTSFPPWPELSGGERCVAAGARDLARKAAFGSEAAVKILKVAEAIETRQVSREPLILVGPKNARVEDLVLVEGYKRATAHVHLAHADEIHVMIGSTERLSEWVPAQ
jgi:hypothetical protein